jgi:transcriptional regulator GlxA family with amidase domain
MNFIKVALVLAGWSFFSCGAKSVKPELNPDWYNVAFLITDGVYNTEFTAPYDIFQHTKFRSGIKAMNVFTVSNTSDYVRTFEGIQVKPDFNFLTDLLPPIDILVVPSAEHHMNSDLENEDLINFIKKTDISALYMTSHCDGAFMLAKSGILNDVYSTTFPEDVQTYKNMYPQLKVKDSVIFVHDGKYITSAGGARSFDAALYLTEVLYGDSIARSIAKGLVLDWDINKVIHFKR